MTPFQINISLEEMPMPDHQYTPNKRDHDKKKGGRPASLLLTLNGITKTAPEWAKQLNLPLRAIHVRIQRKWTDERTLTTPQNEYIKHGMGRHPLMGTWREMLRRCYDPAFIYYSRYGGRGIRVCRGWLSITRFIGDVGLRPDGKTIDRKDNDGGYWCGHCDECKSNNWPLNWKWSTDSEQQLNRHNNRLLTFQGRTQAISVWAREFNLNLHTLRSRLEHEWSMEKALTYPLKRKHKG